jgi:hypothetical protein
MDRHSKNSGTEYQPLAKDSEALWAFVAVLALLMILHVLETH